MEEDMENGSDRVYRSEWTSEMPRWIGWPSDVSPPAKHVSNDGSSASDDSTVFNETKQISAPPLQLHDFTSSSPLWGHDFLMRSSSLSYDPRLDDRINIDMNMIKREHPSYDFDCQFQPAAAGLPLISRKALQMPAMFPAVAAGEEEGQISTSLSCSGCKPPLAAASHGSNQLLFYRNSLPFWKANTEIPSAKLNSVEGPRQEKHNCGNVAQTKDSGMDNRKSSTESSPKRPRSEPVAPFTTFKVRKEKLGDRINALQQLVSPFGKTDTASVLFDAIEYIKLLHDQVTVLSTPYMRMSQERCEGRKERDGTDEQGLRSRGLCLVPIATTLHVAKDNISTDFWAPTFGGSYR